MPDLFQVHAETVDGGNKALYSTGDIPVHWTLGWKVFVSITDRISFKAYRKYNAIITTKNNFGESNSTGEIPFSKPVCIASCIDETHTLHKPW